MYFFDFWAKVTQLHKSELLVRQAGTELVSPGCRVALDCCYCHINAQLTFYYMHCVRTAPLSLSGAFFAPITLRAYYCECCGGRPIKLLQPVFNSAMTSGRDFYSRTSSEMCVDV